MTLAAPIALATPSLSSIYEIYSGLAATGSLGGSLLAVLEMDAAGIATLIAGGIAGAAVLGVDADREPLKQMLRYGLTDFVVNDLDEALRILKNEVRKKRAVSVCLGAELAACVAEMIERGVQPDLLAGRAAEGTDVLRSRGAAGIGEAILGADRPLVLWSLPAGMASGNILSRADQLAAAAIDAAAGDTSLRKAWLERAPRYLGRRLSAERGVAMSASEREAFGAKLAAEGLAERLSVRRDGEPVSL